MWILEKAVEQVQTALGIGRRRFRWYHRDHLGYTVRQARGTTARGVKRGRKEQTVPVSADGWQTVGRPAPLFRVCTLNVRGVKSKGTDLRYFLQKEPIEVLCLQETLQKAASWPLRLSGYRCYAALGENVSSFRGLAVAVANRYVSEPVGKASQSSIFVRISGGDLQKPIFVGTTYIPPRRDKGKILKELERKVEDLRREYPEYPMVLCGYFNEEMHGLQVQLSRWETQLQVLDNVGSRPTRRGRNARQIDHFAYWGTFGDQSVTSATVLGDWDLSDHYPVRWDVQGLRTRVLPTNPAAGPGNTGRRRIIVGMDDRRRVHTSNRWAILADEFLASEEDPRGLDELAGLWEKACHDVAGELQLHQKPRKVHVVRASRRTALAIERRRAAFRQVVKCENDLGVTHPQTKVAHRRYELLAVIAKRLSICEKKRLWFRQIREAHQNMVRKPRDFWQWARMRGGWSAGSGTCGIVPIYDEQRRLLTDTSAIAARWKRHFQGLCADETGHSRDKVFGPIWVEE